jgi:hypothetical protein
MPQPAGEVEADGIGRGVGVSAGGRVPPEDEFELGEGVEPLHLLQLRAFVPEVCRVLRERVSGQGCHHAYRASEYANVSAFRLAGKGIGFQTIGGRTAADTAAGSSAVHSIEATKIAARRKASTGRAG